MIRIGLLVTFYFMFLLPVCASNTAREDSLLALLPSAPDSVKVAMLNELCWELKYTDIHRAFAYGEEAISIATRINCIHGEALANANLGHLHILKGNFLKAIELLIKSIKLEKIIGKKNRLAYRYNTLGLAYYAMKDYRHAQEWYHESLRTTRDISDKRPELFALKGLGVTYLERRLCDSAKIYFNAMHQLAVDQEDQGMMGNALRHLGETEMVSGGHENALQFFWRSMARYQSIGRQAEQAIVWVNLGTTYELMKKYEKAMAYYKKSLEIRREIDNKYGILICKVLMANLFLEMNAADKAIENASEGLTLALQLENKEYELKAFHILSQSYRKQQIFEKALEYQDQYLATVEKYHNEKNSQQIARLQSQFDLEAKEQQIKSQLGQIQLLEVNKATERKLRFAMLGGVLLFILLSVILYVRYCSKQKAERILQGKNREIALKNIAIEKMNRELEKKMLRAQMNPHFIFNSLSAIQHLIIINDKASALKYLSKFSKLTRQVLESSLNHKVSIADEIKLLEYYLQLESLRFSNQFEYSIEVDQDIDVFNIEIPFLLLQPVVENAIIHGLRPKEGRGSLSISLQQKANHILCSVEDNGIGRLAAGMNGGNTIERHVSLGMSVTQRRLGTLNKNINIDCVSIIDLFDLQHQPSGTRVEIKVPLEIN